MMVGRDVDALYGSRAIPEAGAGRAGGQGPDAAQNARGSACDRTDRRVAHACARARSSALPASSAPAAPKPRARSSAPTDSTRARSLIEGRPVAFTCPQDAMQQRHRPRARGSQEAGAVPPLAIRTNVTIAAHDQISRLGVFIDEGKENKLVEQYRRLLSIRMASPDQAVGNLSGGNQQKVVLARWLALRPKILIVDEPTRGIDIGAKVEVHNLLVEMAQGGHRRHRHLVGTAGDAGDSRPHRDDARGPRHRRDQSRRRRRRKS